MISPPLLWGAGLVCAVGGAIAGTALGSSPVVAASATTEYYQNHETSSGRQPTVTAGVMPDRYPLVTARGTIRVAQLSERGLFSQTRYRVLDRQPYVEPASYVAGNDAAPGEAQTVESDPEHVSAPGMVAAAVRITRDSQPAEFVPGTSASPVGEAVLAL